MAQSGDIHVVAPEMAVAFFKGIMPFDSLDDATLNDIARHCRIDFYPKGTHLYLI